MKISKRSSFLVSGVVLDLSGRGRDPRGSEFPGLLRSGRSLLLVAGMGKVAVATSSGSSKIWSSGFRKMPLLDPLLTFLCPPLLLRLFDKFRVFGRIPESSVFIVSSFVLCGPSSTAPIASAAFVVPVTFGTPLLSAEYTDQSDIDCRESDSGISSDVSLCARLWLLACAPFSRCALSLFMVARSGFLNGIAFFSSAAPGF